MIIGLAGAKHSGKNTAANFIAEHFDKSFSVKQWSFAEDLKISAIAALTGKVLPANEALKIADDLKDSGEITVYSDNIDYIACDSTLELSGREYLQWHGTEAHREVFGQNFWVDNLLNKIAADTEEGKWGWENRLDIITDVRFPNESKGIREIGGKVLRVRRSSVENDGDSHASEIPLPNDLVDLEIINENTLEDLEVAAVSATKEAVDKIVANRVPYA